MKVSDLTLSELRFQLANMGIFLRTGPFINHVTSKIASVAQGIHLLYADYELQEQAKFADFHITLRPPLGFRRWLKPQVFFLIDGEPSFKPLPYNQAFPMLEWGLNWCVSSNAHRYLIIHAAVVEKNGYAAILPAPPGSGKSTLCASLVNRGWRLLSDELTLVDTQSGRIIALPRPVSLKNRSIDVVQAYEPSVIMSPKVSDTIKGTVAHMKPSCDSILRSHESAQAAWIIFPKYIADTPTILDNIPKSRGFMRVAENSFNYSALGTLGFNTLVKLINGCQCYDFSYSKIDEAITTFNALEPQ